MAYQLDETDATVRMFASAVTDQLGIDKSKVCQAVLSHAIDDFLTIDVRISLTPKDIEEIGNRMRVGSCVVTRVARADTGK